MKRRLHNRIARFINDNLSSIRLLDRSDWPFFAPNRWSFFKFLPGGKVSMQESYAQLETQTR